MKITFHYYVIKYYQTQWTDNRMPYKRGTDNRGSTVSLFIIIFYYSTAVFLKLILISSNDDYKKQRNNN